MAIEVVAVEVEVFGVEVAAQHGGAVGDDLPSQVKYNISIDFAWRTFRWDNRAKEEAKVHCVILGFSNQTHNRGSRAKNIITADGQIISARNINAYLLDGPNTFVESRQHPLCNVPKIKMGNQPIDDGHYIFTEEEKNEFLKKEPQAERYFHVFWGGKEFLYNKKRYCLWLGECQPSEIMKMPECLKRVQSVREYRLKSGRATTRKLANKPTAFQTENMPDSNYIAIPEVSSENYSYVPLGFMTPDILCSNKMRLMLNASLFHFGVLVSNVHNIWTNTVCGTLETRLDYSIKVVYNNFPWPKVTEAQKNKIEETAQLILDARQKYPDCTYAQLYGKNSYLFTELVAAHKANDHAVMEAYGFAEDLSEKEIVWKMLELYEKLTANQPEAKSKGRKKTK